MLFWRLGVLMATAAIALPGLADFIKEPPEIVRRHFSRTKPFSGCFIQNKTNPDGRSFISHGVWRIDPGHDFEWRITEPFDSLFRADMVKYSYSNEDEVVEKPLDELPYLSSFLGKLERESVPYDDFFRAFDTLYKEEENGVFHLLAKPRDARLAKFLSRVEADGVATNWTLKAVFPDKTTFAITCIEE